MITQNFTAHPNLIRMVIERQAGTITKCLLEGVMNSIDAGATEIHVSVAEDRVGVSDNGAGFTSKGSIAKWFGEFGNPHETTEDGYSTDAKFGTFRSGRGQLFAFGVNTWVTNTFKMCVDIKGKGLTYTLKELKKSQPGCNITVELYDKLTSADMDRLKTELSEACAYAEVDVFLNEQRINKTLSEETWDVYNDNFCLRVRKNNKGLRVYNMGILVETIPAYVYGVSGDVYSKQQLKLNFARNQVIRSCSRWKRIVKAIEGMTEDAFFSKKTFTEAELSAGFARIRALLAETTLNTSMLRKYSALPIFTDVTGKKWSADTLAAARWSSEYAFKSCTVISLSDEGGMRGDRIMQKGVAVVLSLQTLEASGCLDGYALAHMIRVLHSPYGMSTEHVQFRPMCDLEADTPDVNELLPMVKVDDIERLALQTLEAHGYAIGRILHGTRIGYRVFRLGLSTSCYGWTDGHSYVAINRTYLNSCDLTKVEGWVRLLHLVVHEMTHLDSAENHHIHGKDFYKCFHDGMGKLAHLPQQMMTYYAGRVSAHHKVLERRLAKIKARNDELAAKITVTRKKIIKTSEAIQKANSDTAEKKSVLRKTRSNAA